MQANRKTNSEGRLFTGCDKCDKTSCELRELGDADCEYEDGVALHYVFHYGKYKGHALSDVMTKDPQYVIWMSANAKWFVLSNTARTFYVDENPGMEQDLHKAEIEYESKFISNNTEINERDTHFQIDNDGDSDIHC